MKKTGSLFTYINDINIKNIYFVFIVFHILIFLFNILIIKLLIFYYDYK